MSRLPPVVMFGSSGHGAGFIAALAQDRREGCRAEVVAVIDDYRGGQGHEVEGIPVISFAQWRDSFLDTPCFITVADPKARRLIADRLAEAGGVFVDFYAGEHRLPGMQVGRGTYLHPMAYALPNVIVGEHVQVMPLTVIGHDVRIGNFVSLCPSVTVSGYVHIEDEAFIGAGAVLSNGTAAKPLVIGRGARVGVGAVVTKSVAPGASVMGNPARPLRELARARRGE